MSKNMFKPVPPNYWFSQLALFVSLIALITLSLVTYLHFTDESNVHRVPVFIFYLYLSYSTGILLLGLTMAAWHLRAQVKLLPLAVCLVLIICYVMIALINKMNIQTVWQPFALFSQLMFSLGVISGLWWLSVISPPQQFALVYYNMKGYRLWAWLALLMVFTAITLEFWVRSHSAIYCQDLTLCNWKTFASLNLGKLINFWMTDQFKLADLGTLLRMVYHSFLLFILVYFASISLFLLFNKYLTHIGVLNYLALTLKIAIGFSNTVWLVEMVDFFFLILLLLNTIAFMGNLYPKLQSTGWAYQNNP